MIGTSPPIPKWEISVTPAAKVAATPASIALPPRASMRMPASAAKCRPAATTPTLPTTSGRYVEEPTIPSAAKAGRATTVTRSRPSPATDANRGTLASAVMRQDRRYHRPKASPPGFEAAAPLPIGSGRRRRPPEADLHLEHQNPGKPLRRVDRRGNDRAVRIGGLGGLDVQ